MLSDVFPFCRSWTIYFMRRIETPCKLRCFRISVTLHFHLHVLLPGVLGASTIVDTLNVKRSAKAVQSAFTASLCCTRCFTMSVPIVKSESPTSTRLQPGPKKCCNGQSDEHLPKLTRMCHYYTISTLDRSADQTDSCTLALLVLSREMTER